MANTDIRGIEDATLVELFKNGESRAFDEIDRRYRPRIIHFLRVRTKSQELAEDLTQETFSRALVSLQALRNGVFLSGWLYRIAFHTFVDYVRHDKLRINAVSYDEHSDVSEPRARRNDVTLRGAEKSVANMRRPDGTTFSSLSPSDRLERAEEKVNLWKVARNILTPNEFQIIWLRYVDEASDVEIATRLGKTHIAVRVILSRARKKLYKYLQKR